MASGKIPVAGIPDVWGHDFGQPKEVPTPPVIVLRAQAAYLGQRTGNMLVGKVASTGADEGGVVNDTLYIQAPLINFSMRVVTVQHQVYPYYPAKVISNEPPMRPKPLGKSPIRNEAKSPDELIAKLGKILGSEWLTGAIKALLAQSEGTSGQ